MAKRYKTILLFILTALTFTTCRTHKEYVLSGIYIKKPLGETFSYTEFMHLYEDGTVSITSINANSSFMDYIINCDTTKGTWQRHDNSNIITTDCKSIDAEDNVLQVSPIEFSDSIYATDDKGIKNEGNNHHTNDSIIVTYVNFSRQNKFWEYNIIYSPSNNCLTIHPMINKDNVMIVQDDDKQKFISFIEEFYIRKKSNIIEYKILKDERVEYDIPRIEVSCYNGTSRTIYSQTYLGDGEYELIFNPNFMDFQKLLIKLINEYDRNNLNPKPPYRCRYY